MPGRERRVGPLEHHHRHGRPPGDRGAHDVQPPPQVGHQARPPRLATGRLAERADRPEHLVEVLRVQRQHLGPAAQVGQRVVDHRHVDRADRAQVLGHDQVGVEVGQRPGVQVVEVLPGRHPGAHRGVDLGRRQPLGQRAGRHDPPLAGLRRVVALEGHADDVVAGAEVEEDLGGRRQQRHDAHERPR